TRERWRATPSSGCTPASPAPSSDWVLQRRSPRRTHATRSFRSRVSQQAQGLALGAIPKKRNHAALLKKKCGAPLSFWRADSSSGMNTGTPANRRLYVSMIVSLDGFIEGPEHELDWFLNGDAAFERYSDEMVD